MPQPKRFYKSSHGPQKLGLLLEVESTIYYKPSDNENSSKSSNNAKCEYQMNWTDLTSRFKFSKDPMMFEKLHNLDPVYEVNLPESYQEYLEHFGAGFLGGFYHFHSPAHMNTHRERLAPFEDTELDHMLKENDSGEILIFATSENGDMLGWRLSEFNNLDEPRILKIPTRSFEVVELASNVKELIEQMIITPSNFWMKLSMTHHPNP